MPLQLFHGDEPYLVERAFAEAWRAATQDLTSDLDGEMLSAESTPAEVLAAAAAVGFFTPNRVIGIREWQVLRPASRGRGRTKADAADPSEEAARFLDQIPAEVEVIISAPASVAPGHPVLKLVQSKGRALHFQRLRAREIPGWVAQRCRDIGLKLEPKAARLLADSVGDDLRLIDSELHKLLIYAAGDLVGEADVQQLVPDTAEHQIWDLTDRLLSDPGRAAMELDRALAAGEPAGRISFMLARHLRLLLAASEVKPGPRGAKLLAEAFAGDGRPLSDFALDKAMTQARGVDPTRLEALYRRAAAAEAASRRGDLDEAAALRLVVLGAALG